MAQNLFNLDHTIMLPVYLLLYFSNCTVEDKRWQHHSNKKDEGDWGPRAGMSANGADVASNAKWDPLSSCCHRCLACSNCSWSNWFQGWPHHLLSIHWQSTTGRRIWTAQRSRFVLISSTTGPEKYQFSVGFLCLVITGPCYVVVTVGFSFCWLMLEIFYLNVIIYFVANVLQLFYHDESMDWQIMHDGDWRMILVLAAVWGVMTNWQLMHQHRLIKY